MLMESSISAFGKMVNRVAKVYIIMQMVPIMKVSGSMTSMRERVRKFGQTAQFMKVNIRMV